MAPPGIAAGADAAGWACAKAAPEIKSPMANNGPNSGLAVIIPASFERLLSSLRLSTCLYSKRDETTDPSL